MPERRPGSGDRPSIRREAIVLLLDFDNWFTQLPLRLPGVSRLEIEPLRTELQASLARVATLTTHSLEYLRALTSQHVRTGEFRVTLDGGAYFTDFNFSFAMTRAVTRLEDAARDQLIRVARQGFGQFWTQVAMLRRAYETSQAEAIVICDDGIDTGRSLGEVIRQLSGQFLEVSGVRVLLNPHGINELKDEVPVETLIPDAPVHWTHERDLFWGSPTGGVSFISSANVNELSGIPYTFSEELLRRRLGLNEGDIGRLRHELLEVNLKFWRLLSRAAGRVLRLRDSNRLSWAYHVDAPFNKNTPICDVIEWLLTHDPPGITREMEMA
jgi:hypothetical protein